MWFLNGRPNKINVDSLLTSISGGYQNTSYRFTVQKKSPGPKLVKKEQEPVEAEDGEMIQPEPVVVEEPVQDDGKVFVAIAFPWCSNREDGSLNIMNLDDPCSHHLDKICPSENVTVLQKDDVTVWERLRALKSVEGVELATVQEMITWYLDDIGVMTLWIESGKTYQLNYSHKIAADSKLFLPTRLPVFVNQKELEMNYRLWTIDAKVYELPKFLKRGIVTDQERQVVPSDKCLHRLEFKGWQWDEDTRISTDNWDSSDDEGWTSSEDEVDPVEEITATVAETTLDNVE